MSNGIYEEREWFAERFPDRRADDPQRTERSNIVVVNDPMRLELHLSCSKGLLHGPIIERSGKSPPSMADVEQPGNVNTDPDLQRIGSYFVTTNRKWEHIHNLFSYFAGTYCVYGSLQRGTGSLAADAHEAASQVVLTYFPRGPAVPQAGSMQTIASLHGAIEAFATSSKSFFDECATQPNSSSSFRIIATWLKTEFDAAKCVDQVTGLIARSEPIFPGNFDALQSLPSFADLMRRLSTKYLRLLLLALTTDVHQEVAMEMLGKVATPEGTKESELVLMQGCGDLTMNDWNVAFVTGPSWKGEVWSVPGGSVSEREEPWKLIHRDGEPLNDRSYTCLIKWACERTNQDLIEIAQTRRIVHPYQIATVKFLAPSLQTGPPDRHVFLKGTDRERDAPIGHLIEFAVYGQQLYVSGEERPLQTLIREFADARHVFKLPNLNPKADFTSEIEVPEIREYAKQPRTFFDSPTYDDT